MFDPHAEASRSARLSSSGAATEYGILCGMRFSRHAALAVAAASVFAQAPARRIRDWDRPFPPHKIIGNVYSVGMAELGSFLITGKDGHILINSDFEKSVPFLQKNIQKLGFRMTDIKIIVGSHAHADHMEGDALLKELTGARVMAMRQDVDELRKLTPGGKPHPVDHVLEDGEVVRLGSTAIKAHLTAGHTRGCTSWSFQTEENGKKYDVVVVGSVGWNTGYQLWKNRDYPSIAEDYRRSFRTLRALKCDIFLGGHPEFYDGEGKYAKLGRSSVNPFIDRAGYDAHIAMKEREFEEEFARQKRENP